MKFKVKIICKLIIIVSLLSVSFFTVSAQETDINNDSYSEELLEAVVLEVSDEKETESIDNKTLLYQEIVELKQNE